MQQGNVDLVSYDSKKNSQQRMPLVVCVTQTQRALSWVVLKVQKLDFPRPVCWLGQAKNKKKLRNPIGPGTGNSYSGRSVQNQARSRESISTVAYFSSSPDLLLRNYYLFFK